ncbi:MAG: DUF2855 family protein [Pseudomonadota bacterium]
MGVETVTLQSERANLKHRRLASGSLGDPQAGEVLVRVDRFALTANNVTYGVAGDSIGYWQFFPAEGEWGCIPVWGFGEVVASAHDEVPVGERLYGYFPMGSHVILKPGNISRGGLVDTVEHRAALPPVYNQYTRTAADAAYDPSREAEQMLYRPLFTTSFFLDDFLDDNNFFDAGVVVLTSASSKTSIGLAHLLHANRGDRCRVIGLTSAGNADFVKGLGCYDQTLTYDAVDQLERVPTVMVDMAGSASVRAAVHGHLKDSLNYSCAVGATHWEDATVGQGAEALPGPKPEMFFAPSQIQKRIKEWGQDAFTARLGEAWQGFIAAADGWIHVETIEGGEGLCALYDDFIANRADPAKGYVVSLP